MCVCVCVCVCVYTQGGEGTDQEWAAGKTLSGATVIRQRPVTVSV